MRQSPPVRTTIKLSMQKVLFGLLSWLLLLAWPQKVSAAELKVAAAADLKYALDELSTEFQTTHPGLKVDITYGSSGSFYAQLQNGAPFDLFLSADIAYPRKLAEAGLALGSNVFRYAVGRIVVWVPRASALDVQKLGIQALVVPGVKKIAVANPAHAPYGRAAVAAMKALGVYEQAAPKLVYGENIAQTAQFIQSGAADIGIIALSLALAPPMHGTGRYWQIPVESYPPLEQGGIILRDAKEPGAAASFRDFVLRQRGRAVLKRYGFALPAS